MVTGPSFFTLPSCGGAAFSGQLVPLTPQCGFWGGITALCTPVLAHPFPVLEHRDWWEQTGIPSLARGCFVQHAEE